MLYSAVQNTAKDSTTAGHLWFGAPERIQYIKSCSLILSRTMITLLSWSYYIWYPAVEIIYNIMSIALDDTSSI